MVLTALFITGLAVGSFLNVLIDRLPQGKSIFGRSRCDFCHKQLRWYDLLPVVSYTLLRGKCRYCHKGLSPQYFLIELLTGVMFILTWIYIPTFQVDLIQGQLSFDIQTLRETYLIRILYLGVTASLIAIFFADLKYQIIPDSLQLALLVFALGIVFVSQFSMVFLTRKAIDAALIMSPILALFILTRGRGMGFGDVKLAFTMGILLGTYGGLIALYVAFVSGGIVGLILLFLKRRKLKSKIAFGPFLVIGTFVVFFFRNALYLELFYLINSWRFGS